MSSRWPAGRDHRRYDGTAVATGVNETTVEFGSEIADYLGGKAADVAARTSEAVTDSIPEACDNVKAAFVNPVNSEPLARRN